MNKFENIFVFLLIWLISILVFKNAPGLFYWIVGGIIFFSIIGRKSKYH